jgi:hypothetical protein
MQRRQQVQQLRSNNLISYREPRFAGAFLYR